MYNFSLAKAVFTFAKLYKKLFLAVTVTGLDLALLGVETQRRMFLLYEEPQLKGKAQYS